MSGKKSLYDDFRLTTKRENDLRRHGPAILNTLILSEKFFSILRADSTLTREMEDDIQSKPTPSSRISKLLDIIPKRGNSGFETFLKALVDTHQEALAQLLDEIFASNLIKERDAKCQSNSGGQQVQDGEVMPDVPSNVSSNRNSTEIGNSSAVPATHVVLGANQPANNFYPWIYPHPNPPYTQFTPQDVNNALMMPWWLQSNAPAMFMSQDPGNLHQSFPKNNPVPAALPNSLAPMDKLAITERFESGPVPPFSPPTNLNTEPPVKNDDLPGEDETDVGLTDWGSICPFLDKSTLKEYLKGLSPKKRQQVIDFITAVTNNANMKIEVEKMKDTDQAVKLIKDEDCYLVRRQPYAGLVVLIANEVFFSEDEDDLKPRHGTKFDILNVKSLFEQLNFRVRSHNNLTSKEIRELLVNLSKNEDFGKLDVFVLIVMSHGIRGEVYGSDGKSVSIEEIINGFDGKNCEQLKGKPKLFFFQSCQTVEQVKKDNAAKKSVVMTDGSGDTFDVVDGREDDEKFRLWASRISETDSYEPKLPKATNISPFQTDAGDAGPEHDKANIFVAYATYKGYLAWRMQELGSVFIRAMVYVFALRSHEKHVCDMFTELNDLLNYLPSKNGNTLIQQTAQFDSTLRRSLYLFPGYDGRDFT